MIHLLRYKWKNKPLLTVCLLVGASLLIAVFAFYPMFRLGADRELLQAAFLGTINDSKQYPAVMQFSGSENCDNLKQTTNIWKPLEEQSSQAVEQMQVPAVEIEQIWQFTLGRMDSNLGHEGTAYGVTAINHAENHLVIKRGAGFSELTSRLEDGSYPCIVSENFLDAAKLVMGEKLTFAFCLDEQENPLELTIAGIYSEKPGDSLFWQRSYSIVVPDSILVDIVSNYDVANVNYYNAIILDYTKIDGRNSNHCSEQINKLKKENQGFSTNLTGFLDTHREEQKTLSILLFTLELPCVVLLILFLYMVAVRLMASEEGEIAVLRSRGMTKEQIIRLYEMQSVMLCAAAFLPGMVLGYLFAKLAGGARAFLQISFKGTKNYYATPEMLLFGLGACLLIVIIMSIPVRKKAELTIVAEKARNNYSEKKMLWEKIFLDVILLAVSGYLLFNYNRQVETLRLEVMSGKGLDPLMFLDSTLFVFAAGLLLIRINRGIMKFVDRIGKKRWKPANYVSFLQMRRTYSQQSFLSIFLMMTVAVGIFDANMARTITENTQLRMEYEVGADIVVQERWMSHTYTLNGGKGWYFTGPSYERYSELEAKGIIESATKVFRNGSVYVEGNGAIQDHCQTMAIHTQEFGNISSLPDWANDTHWYHALNALAADPNGVIISKSLAEELNVQVGDRVSYGMEEPVYIENAQMRFEQGNVVAIVEAFPSFMEYQYENDGEKVTEKTEYLLVVNYATMVHAFQERPYQVWIKLAEGASAQEVREYLEQDHETISTWDTISDRMEANENAPMIQVTNGTFTLSFLVSLTVAVVGFLMYWIISLKNRELLFGVLRAMGMRMKEIRRMLLNEQLFGSLLVMAEGLVLGFLTTKLFTKVIALVYLWQKHNLEIRVAYRAGDFARVGGILLAAMLLCMYVLWQMLKKMKIARALKMGED